MLSLAFSRLKSVCRVIFWKMSKVLENHKLIAATVCVIEFEWLFKKNVFMLQRDNKYTNNIKDKIYIIFGGCSVDVLL